MKNLFKKKFLESHGSTKNIECYVRFVHITQRQEVKKKVSAVLRSVEVHLYLLDRPSQWNYRTIAAIYGFCEFEKNLLHQLNSVQFIVKKNLRSFPLYFMFKFFLLFLATESWCELFAAEVR